MEQAPFTRVDLTGQDIPVPFEELHLILRDITHYYEVNLNEAGSPLILPAFVQQDYWKYLSISWTAPEGAESKRYAWLCERGCLALLNGRALDYLGDQLFFGSDIWHQAKALADAALPYLRQYTPTDTALERGRGFLIDAFEFIERMSQENLDQDGVPNFAIQDQGAWFTKCIVGDYFKTTAALDFG